MRCPRCDVEGVVVEGPPPGQGGLYRLSCPRCGHEEAGVFDPAFPDMGVQPTWQRPTETTTQEPRHGAVDAPPMGRCEQCGRPAPVRSLPGVPASACYCDEHAPSFTLKPLPILLVLVTLLVALWLLCGHC